MLYGNALKGTERDYKRDDDVVCPFATAFYICITSTMTVKTSKVMLKCSRGKWPYGERA